MNIRPPRLKSTIERRLLVNYRVDPGVIAALLPVGLRPQLVDGSAVAGICLLRQGHVRPAWFAPRVGLGMEGSAHRIAVEWDTATGVEHGVYVPLRHSADPLPVLFGGRLFPGVHARAQLTSRDTASTFAVDMVANDATVHARVELTGAEQWTSSLFATPDDASRFFQAGSVAWSPSRDGKTLQGMRLSTQQWRVAPAVVTALQSSFFDALPEGSAVFDNALVMLDVPVAWSSAGQLPLAQAPALASLL
jgi:hypothetical protein